MRRDLATKFVTTLAFATALTLAALPARADSLPPAAEDCVGQSAAPIGGTCSMHDSAKTVGTCQHKNCSRPIRNCDGGPPCGMRDYDCVMCVAADGQAPASVASDGSATPRDAGASTAETKPSTRAGCSIAAGEAPWSALGSLAIAALFALVVRKKK